MIDRLAENLGGNRERFVDTGRLLQDSGMDGDDAVLFFRDVETRFGTDLMRLWSDWKAYFNPEGLSLWPMWFLIPTAAVVGLAGAVGLSFLQIAIPLLVVAVTSWLAGLRRPVRARPRAITVGDVVAAVEAGAWPSHVDAMLPRP